MARRSYRGGRTPTTGGGSGGYDHGGYDSLDDDNDRSCLSPPDAQLEYYQEYAYAAGEPDDDDYKTNMPEIGIDDDGYPKSLSAPSPRSSKHGGAGNTKSLTTSSSSAADRGASSSTSPERDELPHIPFVLFHNRFDL